MPRFIGLTNGASAGLKGSVSLVLLHRNTRYVIIIQKNLHWSDRAGGPAVVGACGLAAS